MTVNPDYDPDTWDAGYQWRQFGVAGPDVVPALIDPPADMVTAAGDNVVPY